MLLVTLIRTMDVMCGTGSAVVFEVKDSSRSFVVMIVSFSS